MLNHGKEFRPAIPALASALLIGLTAPAAQADVILNTFGPGNTAPGTAYGLSNPGQSLAVPFSISSEQTISEILTSISGQGSFTLGVVAGAGLPYGPMLFSASLSNSEPTVLASLSGLNWSLPSGDYWLVGIGAPNSSGFWRGGAVSGTFAYSFLALLNFKWVTGREG